MPRPRQGQHSGQARIIADVRRRIESGELTPGDAIPSNRTLAEIHKVHQSTAERATRALAEEGVIVVRGPGLPSIVAKPGLAEAQERAMRAVTHTSRKLADSHSETQKRRAEFEAAVRAAGAAGISAAEIARRIPVQLDRVPKLDGYAVQALLREEARS